MDAVRAVQEVTETSSEGVWLLDFDGSVRHANPQALRILGAAHAPSRAWDHLPPSAHETFRQHLHDLREGVAQEEDGGRTLLRLDGSSCRVRMVETLLHDHSGRAVGVLERFTDDLRDVELRESLRLSQVEFTHAQQVDTMGGWEWDLEDDVLTASPLLLERFGLQRGTVPASGSALIELVHEEDRARMRSFVREARAGEAEPEFTVRLRGPEGWLWVRGRGQRVMGDNGPEPRLTGTLQDVDDTVGTELALRDQIAQNTLMHAVSIAANRAHTLVEVLRQSRDLLMLHDDWSRARAFSVVPVGAGRRVEPLYAEEEARLADEADPDLVAREQALAAQALAARDLVWDETRLVLAVPLMHGDEVYTVLVVTSDPPLYRHTMIEGLARHLSLQLEQVLEREESARQLTRAHEATEAASRQKSEFLAVVSHEIRNPLNGVLGLSDLLLRTDLTADQRRLVDGVRQSGQAALTLIGEILDFSKAEAGQLTLEEVDVDPRLVVESVTASAAETARAKGLAFDVHVGDEVPPLLRGDPTRLSQVIGNLVGNAVKFTTDGRISVEVAAERADDEVLLSCVVSDTGIGIGPDDAGDTVDIFEPFRQASTSTTRHYGGTGLGLAICREIVTAMDGEIDYDSTSGEGSTFFFTVRLREGVASEVTGSGASAPAPTDTPQRPARVLVVDDQPVNHDVLLGMLASLGHAADSAHDGRAALDLLHRGSYDIVLMDAHMPGMDGYDATRAIRSQRGDGDARIPVLGMTGAVSEADRQRCLDAGMDEVLTKPVDLTTLTHALARWLGDDPTSAPPSAATAAPSTLAATDFASTELDVERLEELRELGPGSDGYLARALTNFLARSPAALAGIEDAASSSDAEQVRFRAHALAGSAANIGAPRVTDQARVLELLGESGDLGGASEETGRLSSALEAAHAELARYRAVHFDDAG